MATITYTDLDGSCPSTTFHGRDFVSGKGIESDDAALIEAASKNPWFAVSGGEDAGGKKKGGDGSEPATGPYTAKHKGGGKWAVLKGDEVVAEGLTKDQAEDQAASLNEGASH